MCIRAVAQFETSKQPTAKKSIKYIHKSGESSSAINEDIDLVSMCLVSHELPAQVSRDIFAEAYNLLVSGGAISIMDMNPNSDSFQKFASNAFAFAAFKSTEPWIQEYVSMDLEETLLSIGFRDIVVLPNSPRHRTIVAYK